MKSEMKPEDEKKGALNRKSDVKQGAVKSGMNRDKKMGADLKKTMETIVTDPGAAALNKGIHALGDFLANMPDEDEVLSKRKPHLAALVMDPFVGDYNMKRIIMGVFALDTIYDPLEEVEEYKFWNMKDYTAPDE